MKYLFLFCVLVIFGCSSEPSPIPPDEDRGIIVYKNITNLTRYEKYIEGTFIHNKELYYLKAEKYNILIDAKEPYWEIHTLKKYKQWKSPRFGFYSYYEYTNTIHISKLEDITRK